MRTFDFYRYAFGIFAVVAMFAGCGESQPPIGAPGAVYAWNNESPIQKNRAALLYVVNDVDTVYVVNYATGQIRQVLTLAPYASGAGACSDASGHVFIIGDGGNSRTAIVGEIYEYQHGGQNPIAVLNEPNVSPTGCAVDPVSGDLAVTNQASSTTGNVAVYPPGQSTPKTYTDPSFSSYVGATYDNLGNLYIIGYDFSRSTSMLMAELPSGGSALTNITLNRQILNGTCIQWDGTYLAVTKPAYDEKTSALVYRISVSGSSARVVRTVKFPDAKGFLAGEVSLITPRRIIFTLHGAQVGIFRYPAGGKILRKIVGLARFRKVGLALSN